MRITALFILACSMLLACTEPPVTDPIIVAHQRGFLLTCTGNRQFIGSKKYVIAFLDPNEVAQLRTLMIDNTGKQKNFPPGLRVLYSDPNPRGSGQFYQDRLASYGFVVPQTSKSGKEPFCVAEILSGGTPFDRNIFDKYSSLQL